MSQSRRKAGSGKSDESINEKVRQMKEKQKQWMQERQNARSGGDTKSRPSSGNKQGLRRNPSSSTNKASDLTWISKDDNYASSPGKRASKLKTTPRSDIIKLSSSQSTGAYARGDKAGESTERSRGSRRSETSVTGFDEGKQKSTGTAGANHSNGASSFNALADNITEQLQVQEQNRSKKGEPPVIGHKDKPMSNHVCSGCNSLMAPPHNSPIAIIPCGHTFCQVCVADYIKCPQCQSEVFSTAPNTVMEQIIADFSKRQEKERLKQLEAQTRKYVEEYQNLNLRCEGLADEADRILNCMESITEDIIEEKRVGRKFEKENEDMRSKIKELELELEHNEELMQDSTCNCHALEQSYEEEKQKLTLIEDTIKTIRNSKERAKIMIQNLAPNLKLDDSF